MSGALLELHQDLQDLVGKTVADRYRVDALIGVGGMAAVFRAHHLGLKRDVAIKILHPHLTANREISSRFDREAESASRLEHPNTIQVTDFGSTETGMKFMVMQLLEGRELGELLDRPMPPLRAVELILQILRGLDHAHRQGVVHRDIKPENVFIARDHDGREVLKLVDFGISKILRGSAESGHKTTAGLVFGTPAYMSPEQAAGMEADGRADLYSAGIILYQMLAGRLPFDSEDPVALVRMQVARDADPLPRAVPPVLAGVVQRLLVKDREQRFQTAAEVIDTLESIIPLLDGQVGQVEITPIYADRSTGPHPMLGSASTGPILAADYPSGAHGTHPAASGSLHHPSGFIPGAHQHHTTGLTRPGLAEGRRQWPWMVAIGASTIAAISLTVAFLGGGAGESAEASDPSDPTEARGSSDPDDPDARPDPSLVARIDNLILGNKVQEAEELLKPLRDQFPDSPALMWRQGRLLAKMKRKQSQALSAYGGALAADPSLMEDRDFYAELYDLLRYRRNRDEALDLSLQKMGPHGHKFLLELVNDTKRPLPYHDRQRALEELRRDPANLPLINRKLNLALDLLQASKSMTPCRAYRDGLEAIAAEPDYYFYPRVQKAEMPQKPGPGLAGVVDEDPAACTHLPSRRDEVLAMLGALDPAASTVEDDGVIVIEAADSEGAGGSAEPAAAGSAAGKPSGSASAKKKSSGRNSAECRKFGAIFNKKCRR